MLSPAEADCIHLEKSSVFRVNYFFPPVFLGSFSDLFFFFFPPELSWFFDIPWEKCQPERDSQWIYGDSCYCPAHAPIFNLLPYRVNTGNNKRPQSPQVPLWSGQTNGHTIWRHNYLSVSYTLERKLWKKRNKITSEKPTLKKKYPEKQKQFHRKWMQYVCNMFSFFLSLCLSWNLSVWTPTPSLPEPCWWWRRAARRWRRAPAGPPESDWPSVPSARACEPGAARCSPTAGEAEHRSQSQTSTHTQTFGAAGVSR